MTLFSIRKMVAGLLLAIAALTVACSNNQVRPAQLTGEEPQERHATGIESQAHDM